MRRNMTIFETRVSSVAAVFELRRNFRKEEQDEWKFYVLNE